MVQKINNKFIKDVCRNMKFYDMYGNLPNSKMRIDITISQKAIVKLKGKNKSKYINGLILK